MNELIGLNLGHYRIAELIGAGGMGEVYRAHDERLDRDVAIKVLPAESLTDENARARLLREARMAARLNHPHVCTVYEVGESDGRVYIAMELVEGDSLATKLTAEPFRGDQSLRYGIQIADALAHAHQRRVVHRDLKSANVMITREGRAKVLDFGLAKQLFGEELTEATTQLGATLTVPGSVVGTLAYMAPEQLRGQPADSRSDVWALGVVLYEMFAGRRPFAGTTGYELSSAILNEPPPPLPDRLPAGIRAVVERCLAKEPGGRFQNAGEARTALEVLQSGGDVASVPATRVPGRMRRHRWSLVAASVVAALGLAAVLDLWSPRGWLQEEASVPKYRALAVLPLANLTGDPEQRFFVDGITESLINGIAQLGSMRVISRTSVVRYRETDKPLREIATELNVDAIIEGSLQRIGDSIRVTLRLMDAASDRHIWADDYEYGLADVLRGQSEIVRSVAREVDVRLTPEQESTLASSREVNPAVYEAYLRGMYFITQYSEESIERGLKVLHEAVTLDPAEPLAYAGLAEGYVTIGHSPDPPPETFPRAKAAAEKALSLDPDNVQAIGALADIALYHEWDWDKAERLFERAKELNPSLAMNHYHHAWKLALFNRLDEAIVEHKLARDLDPLRPVHTAWLGGLYVYAGRYDEALTEARKAMDLNPDYGPSYYVMVNAYSRKGMYEEAIAVARKTVDSTSKYAGPALLGIAYAHAGRRAEAMEIAERMDRSRNYFAAQIYAALGDDDTAIDLLEECYRDRTPILPWIRVHGSGFDSLRGEPRFRALLEKMNLPL
jgi:serine/threonine-protein kinase